MSFRRFCLLTYFIVLGCVAGTANAEDEVLLLPLDEGTGTTTADASGSGNDGTLRNGAVFEADTGDGSAYAVRLDGSDDYIDVGTLDVGGLGLTLACRLKADDFPGSAKDPRLISKATGTAANDHIFMLSTIRVGTAVHLRGRVRVGGTTTTLIAGSGDLGTGQWYHAALTHDGAQLRLYLDGVEVGSTALAGTVDTDPGMGVAIGAQPPGAGARYFDGLLDDVRILQRGLSAAEVAALSAENEPPVAVDDSYELSEDETLTVDASGGVLANDTDAEFDPLQALLVEDVSNGSLTLNADGSFVYTPAQDFNGMDSFTYRADDGSSQSSPGMVTLTVLAINDAPEAEDDVYHMQPDTPLSVATPGVLGNDSDVDLDPLEAVLVSNVSTGSLTLNADGSFDYTPPPGFSGTAGFTYQVVDAPWAYEVEITVGANGVVRHDKPAEVSVDMTLLLSALGDTRPLDVASLRVVEVNGTGEVIRPLVPFQFDPAPDFDAASKAAGGLVFLAEGETAVGSDRHFKLLFDAIGGVVFQAPAFADRVVVTDNIFDEGQASFRVETPAAEYYYQKEGAGFSSLVDADGNDWISYNPGGGADGAFRGIPNMVYPEGHFHPGASTGVSSLMHDGVLRATIESVTGDGLWKVKWEIFPEYATLNVLQTAHSYWVLYEGTPGGTLEPAQDRVVRADGTDTLASVNWLGDLVGEEWVYFADPAKGRSLFLANHQDDTATDSYFPLNGEMTVFGFGRNGLTSELIAVPAEYSIGLVDHVTYAETREAIQGAYVDLTVVVGSPRVRSPAEQGLPSNLATVTLFVAEPPTAVDDTYVTNEDTPLHVTAAAGVLANDIDNFAPIDLTAVLVSGPSNGTVSSFTGDGAFTYEPSTNYAGTDSFVYEAVDGITGARTAGTVLLTVNPVNDPPIAHDDLYGLAPDTTLSVNEPNGVLSNDADPESDAMTAVLASPVTGGMLTLETDGSFAYTPDPGFIGIVSFTYRADDGSLPSDPATVSLSVDVPPTAVDDLYTTNEDVDLVVSVGGGLLANDVDTGLPGDLMVVLLDRPDHGLLTDFNDDGSFAYRPDADFNGLDTFTYLVVDALHGASGTGTVSITVNPVNDPPIAVEDAYTVAADTPFAVDSQNGVLANDTDPDFDTLQAQLVSGTASGVLNLNADGSFDYTPDNGFTGQDSFTYRAQDAVSSSPAVQVILTVQSPRQRIRPRPGQVVLYTFEEGIGTTIQDISGVGTPLDLTIPSGASVSWMTNGGLSVTGSTLIESASPASKWINAAKASGAMTVEAWVAPANTVQDGPARVVTCSAGSLERNFTLGQGSPGVTSDTWDMRLRTTGTSLNGTPSLSTAPGTLVTGLQHVVYTRDRVGNTRLYVDAVEEASDLFTGDFSNWDETYPLALANEQDRSRPWLGTYRLVALYDRPMDAAEVARNFVAGPELGAFSSDDFNQCSLDSLLWSVVNPFFVGSVTPVGVGSGEAFLRLSVPSGIEHTAWDPGGTNYALRAMQRAEDEDFDLQVKFLTVPNAANHDEGVLVEQDAQNWLRASVYHDAGQLRATVAGTIGGITTVHYDAAVSASTSVYLRVVRTVDQWDFSYSEDGQTWAPLGSPLVQPLVVERVGVYAANPVTPSAFDADVDYFFLASHPLLPEDGDRWTITTATEGRGSVLVDPDQAGYECGDVVTVTAVPNLGWFFAGWGGDASGTENPLEIVLNGDQELLATFVTPGPAIDVWYGFEQSYGHLGRPQRWVNVLGNVSDPDGVLSLTYSLNGGNPVNLRIGSDLRRLQNPGDFNADIDADDLVAGSNTVTFSAMDGAGNVGVETVTIHYTPGTVWPKPYSVDWSTLTSVEEMQDVAHVVDGKWSLENGTVRTAEPGYDRLIEIGDRTWTDYEVTVPITVRQILRSSHGLGVIMRWDGHTDDPVVTSNPKSGWFPLGAILWNWRGSLEVYGNNARILDRQPMPLVPGTTYWFKARVETVPGVGALYRLKVWEDGQPEPAAWSVTGQGQLSDPKSGCLVLLAHHVDANFGAVTVQDIAGLPNAAPVANDDTAFVLPGGTAAVNVLNNDSDSDGVLVPGTVQVTVQPSNGVATVNVGTGVITYTHDGSPTTNDVFRYRVEDDDGDPSNEASVFVTVTDTLPTTFLSDDFNACELGGNWVFVDPSGLGDYALTGAGSGEAVLELSVPAGTTHDAWTVDGGNKGFHGAPRIMQPCEDEDFELEVKFNTVPGAALHNQGIVVEQDEGNWLRFDVFHNAGQLKAFAGQTLAGATLSYFNVPVTPGPHCFLRLERNGDMWTFWYSSDGVSWMQPGSPQSLDLVVEEVGVYAANPGVATAFTAEVDYFFNMTYPIPNEDGDLLELDLTVLTNGNGFVVVDPTHGPRRCGDSVQLTAVADPGWVFSGWSGDLVGSTNPSSIIMDVDKVITATFVEFTNAPPMAFDDFATVIFGASAEIDVLVNDEDTDGTLVPSTVMVSAPPTHGTTSVNPATGQITYMHNGSPSTNDSFRYTVDDDAGDPSNEATVWVTFVEAPFRSDDFNRCDLGGDWVFVDPSGLGDYTLTGAGSGEAVLELSVPAGTTHDAWTVDGGNKGFHGAPRIMQPCEDEDFELEVKFNTVPGAALHNQGIVVEQDAANWLRFDLYHSGGQLRAFAGETVNGDTASYFNNPVTVGSSCYLRLARNGDSWTFWYSADGATWIQPGPSRSLALNVQQVGVYAGNPVIADAFTAEVDYFENTNLPLAREDLDTLTLELTTNGGGSLAANPDQASYACGDLVEITASPDVGWLFDSWSGDVTGATNPIFVVMNGDRSVEAIFIEESPPADEPPSQWGQLLSADEPPSQWGQLLFLRIARDSEGVYVAWPAGVTGASEANLESTTPDSSNRWQSVTTPTEGTVDEYRNRIDPSDPVEFFRLRTR